MKTISLILLCAISASAQQFGIAWDRSQPEAGVTNYLVLASTNGIMATNLAAAPIRINAGLSTLMFLSDIKPGNYSFTVVAQNSQGVLSDPSNILQVDVPRPARNLHTVVVQYAIGVTNPGNDVGVFKFRIEPPSFAPPVPGNP